MSTNEMTAKIRELKELKAMAEELAQEITAIEDAIKAEMTNRNTEEMVVDIFKVRWTTVKSDRFDTTAFKKALPDLAKQFTKTSTTRRFSIA
jgi:predicted phage-related endonuclease